MLLYSTARIVEVRPVWAFNGTKSMIIESVVIILCILLCKRWTTALTIIVIHWWTALNFLSLALCFELLSSLSIFVPPGGWPSPYSDWERVVGFEKKSWIVFRGEVVYEFEEDARKMRGLHRTACFPYSRILATPLTMTEYIGILKHLFQFRIQFCCSKSFCTTSLTRLDLQVSK